MNFALTLKSWHFFLKDMNKISFANDWRYCFKSLITISVLGVLDVKKKNLKSLHQIFVKWWFNANIYFLLKQTWKGYYQTRHWFKIWFKRYHIWKFKIAPVGMMTFDLMNKNLEANTIQKPNKCPSLIYQKLFLPWTLTSKSIKTFFI